MYPGMYHGQKDTSFSTDYVRNNILVLISIFIYAELYEVTFRTGVLGREAQPGEIFTFPTIHGGALQVPAVTFVLICVVHKISILALKSI